MTKDRKESTKKLLKKNSTKKSTDTFLKSQQNVVVQLKNDLDTSSMELQKSLSLIVAKNSCIADLEKILQERNSEIEKLHNDLKLLKEENIQTLKDFSFFRDKFYELETRYDKFSQIFNSENQELKEQLHKHQTEANNKIQELSYSHNDLQQQLLDKSQAVMKLNEQLLETMRNFEHVKTDFGRQQADFALYKTKVEEEKRMYDENNNIQFAKLKDEIVHKDEIIKQCLLNKDNLEKEKNRVIEELNYKIQRIERAFNQPTKTVQPMSSTPKTTNDIQSNQNIPENLNNNVAITRPQKREPLENTLNHELQTTINNENNESDSTPPQRQHKFKRPTQVQPTISLTSTAAASTSNANNNKKRHRPVRQQPTNLNLPATASLNEYSSSSSDEDERDESFIPTKKWRPKSSRDKSFVPASSDTSESFDKIKRFTK